MATPRFHALRRRARPPLFSKTAAKPPAAAGLYDPAHEHDACGVGFVVDIKGRRSHTIVEQGAAGAHQPAASRRLRLRSVNTGDGAGILIQMPDRFLRKVPRRSASRCRRPATTAPASSSSRSGRGAAQQIRGVFEAIVARGRPAAPRLARRADRRSARSARRPSPPSRRSSRSSSAAATPFDPSDADARARFERKLYVIRKRIEHAVDRLATPSPDARALLHPEPVGARRSSTRAC